MSEHTPESIQLLGENVTRYTLAAGNIVVYEVRNNRRQEIDIWIDSMLSNPERFDMQYFMYDFAAKAMLPTPYAISRIEETLTKRPNLKAYVAVVMYSSFVMGMVRPIVERAIRQTRKNVDVRLFLDRRRAVEWLMEQRRAQGAP